jgi:outer membrane protein assembly factor BamA
LRAQLPPCLDGKLPYPTFAEEIREASGERPNVKISIADFKFEGIVHDSDIVRARILKELKERQFESGNSAWLDDVAQNIVRGVFQDRGYFEVQVDDLIVQPLDPNDPQHRVVIIAPVKEGEKFVTGNISIVSADSESALMIPESELRPHFKLEKGDPLNVDKIRMGINSLTRLYSNRGFIDAAMTPNFSIDYKGHLIEVTIRVSEGRKYFVEKLEVLGVDDETKATIEAKVKPGSVFDNKFIEELFNQGRPTSRNGLSYINGTRITRNVEKASINIVFNFAICPPLKN